MNKTDATEQQVNCKQPKKLMVVMTTGTEEGTDTC